MGAIEKQGFKMLPQGAGADPRCSGSANDRPDGRSRNGCGSQAQFFQCLQNNQMGQSARPAAAKHEADGRGGGARAGHRDGAFCAQSHPAWARGRT